MGKVETKGIKKYAYMKRIPYWKIAEQLGVSEMWVYRHLRQSEIEEADAENIIAAIDSAVHERDKEALSDREGE